MPSTVLINVFWEFCESLAALHFDSSAGVAIRWCFGCWLAGCFPFFKGSFVPAAG